MREEVQKLLFLLRRGGKVTHTGDPSLPIEGLAILPQWELLLGGWFVSTKTLQGVFLFPFF